MKTTRKIFALLLCLAMVLGMATTVFAYDVELTGPLTKGHTYEVYQIFTGDLAKVGEDTVLSNIKYGQNYGTVGEAPDAETLEKFEKSTGKVLAKEIAEKVKGTPFGTLDKDNNWKLPDEKVTDVPAGYYLIKDVTNLPEETTDSLSEYIIQVVDDVTMAPKADNLIPGKKINSDDHKDDFMDSDDNKNEAENDAEKADDSVAASASSSNGGIGTQVDFELSVDVPKNADNYTYYYCILNDTLSEGLTLNTNEDGSYAIEVYVGDNKMTENVDYKLTVTTTEDNKTFFEIAMLDAASLADQTIVAKYSATINEKAVIGVVGNPNEFKVIYSNDPNHDYGKKPDHPSGKPDVDKDVPLGETPVIETRTYVTALQVLKTDGNNPLTGAEFELKGKSIKSVIVTGVTYDKDANGDFYMLKDGSYTDEEPRTADIFVEKTGDRDGGYVKDGDGYRVATSEELADDVQLYTKLLKNDHLYKSTTTKYKQTVVDDVVEIEGEVTASAFVDENGIVRFTGLGEGVFTLTELTAPSGYNLLDEPITINIDWTAPADGTTDCTWAAYVKGETEPLPLAKEDNKVIPVFEIEVENKKGSELPETGGIGTTLFYVFGSVMVLAAVILLVTKKRMNMAN